MQDLDKFKNEMNLSGKNVYVGHRYVPKIMGEWDNSQIYEPLSIVQYQGNSFTSGQYVPVGVEITDEEYWVSTGNYNAQVEQYRQDVRNLENDVNNINDEVIAARDGEATLNDRLDKDQQEVVTELSKTVKVTAFNDFKNKIEKAIDENGLNIKTLGAVGDGVTDNYQIIQDAINFLIDDENDLTDTLYIPKGKFLTSQELKLDGWGYNIKGAGRYSEIIAGENVDRALMSSLAVDRKKTNALRSVVIEGIHLNGNGRDIYGFLADGFNRGCQLNNNRITNSGKAQIAINGSWCFTLYGNVIEGVGGDQAYSQTPWKGDGIILGDQETPAEYVAVGVNIPTIIANSIQYVNRGLFWKRGRGGSIISNTFESTESYFSRFDYTGGFIYQGNYHEINRGISDVLIGRVGEETTVTGAVFEGNTFEKRLSTTGTYWRIEAMVNSSLQHNNYVNPSQRQITTGSEMTLTNTQGNIIQYSLGTITENTTIDRTRNNVYSRKIGES